MGEEVGSAVQYIINIMQALQVRYESILIRTDTGKQHGLTANGPEFNLCDNAPLIECGT